MPFFTVVTCVFNSEKYLPQNLLSVQNQTFQDYEHLFVYSKSKDTSLQILKKYLKANKKARLIEVPATGVSSALNAGIKQSKGQYIIHLHSDDYFSNQNVLLKVYEFLRLHPEVDWVYGQIQTDQGIFPKYWPLTSANQQLLKIYNYIPHQAVFIKKNVFKRFGMFDTNYKYCMDYAYWLKVSSHTNWVFMPLLVSFYRQHLDSLSYSASNSVAARREYHLVQSGVFRTISIIILNIYKAKIFLFVLLLLFFIGLRVTSMLNHLRPFVASLEPAVTKTFVSKDIKLTLKYPDYYPVILWLRSQIPDTENLTINCDSKISNSYLCHKRLTQALLYPTIVNYDSKVQTELLLDTVNRTDLVLKSSYLDSLYLYYLP